MPGWRTYWVPQVRCRGSERLPVLVGWVTSLSVRSVLGFMRGIRFCYPRIAGLTGFCAVICVGPRSRGAVVRGRLQSPGWRAGMPPRQVRALSAASGRPPVVSRLYPLPALSAPAGRMLDGHHGELGQRPRVPTENKPFRPSVIKFADSVIIFSSGGPMFSRAQHHHTDHTTGRGSRLRAGRPKGEKQRCVT